VFRVETRHGKSAKNATKLIWVYKDWSCEDRLVRCRLTTLEKRRSRGDLVKAYKIITGKEVLKSERLSELAPNKTTSEQMYI
jgi:hypothetical protein